METELFRFDINFLEIDLNNEQNKLFYSNKQGGPERLEDGCSESELIAVRRRPVTRVLNVLRIRAEAVLDVLRVHAFRCWHPYDGWTYPDYGGYTRKLSERPSTPLNRMLEDDNVPQCLMECAHSQPYNCMDVENIENCLTASPAYIQNPCTGDDLALATTFLQPYKSCMCDKNADACPDGAEPPGTTKIDPFDFEQEYSQTLKDTWNINLPAYSEDPLAKYFMFHQATTGVQNPHGNNNEGAGYWDSASAFIDMRVEYDKVSNKCVPKVKVDGPEEEMRTLISIDGVSTQCILEYAAGIYQKKMANEPLGGDEYIARDYVWGVNHPIDVMGDLRKWQRAASGGAPPTQNDADSKIRVVVSDSEGNEETIETELTYKKYQAMRGILENRKQGMYQDRCSAMPVATDEAGNDLYSGPFGHECSRYDSDNNLVTIEDCDSQKRFRFVYPDTCPRMVDDVEEKRVEQRSKQEFKDTIKAGTMKMGMVGRRINLNTGEEQKDGYFPDLAEMDYCEMNIMGVVDSNGQTLSGLCNLNKVEVPEPSCDFPSLMNTTADMTEAMHTLKGGVVRPSSEYFMPRLGADSWGECSSLIDNALIFTSKQMDIETTECGRNDWGSPEFQADPCCNYELSSSQCCAPRAISFPVPQAAVDTAALAYYCAEDVDQLATAIYAAKDYVEKRKQTTDQHKGCLHDKQTKVEVYRQFSDVGKNCSEEVIGKYDGGEEKSTATCSIDEDCYTGVCRPAGANEKVRYCQTSRATKYVVKCLNDKLEGLDKAKAMMKDIFAEGDMDATEDDVAVGLGSAAGRQMCAGHQGWNFDPDWRNCKGSYNDEGECDEYYCDNFDDCKTKCLATGLSCNSDNDYWSNSGPQNEADCLVDKLNNKAEYPASAGGKFCARCWDGEGNNCEEISEPSQCRLTRTGYGSNKWNEEQCQKATGNPNAFVRDNEHYSNENYCEVPADTYEECIGVDELATCDGDYEDVWACVKDYPYNVYDGCQSLEGGDYTYAAFNKGYPDSEIHTNVCKMYGSGWDDATEEYVDTHCTEGLGRKQLLRSKREACMQALSQETKCYYDDNTVTDQSGCDSLSVDGSFDARFTGGKCQLSSTSGSYYWDSDITQTKFFKVAEKCNTLSLTESKWKMSIGKIWSPGQFDTQAKCEIGACNMGTHLTEEQCGQIERCSRYACDGCERDWTTSDTLTNDNVCVYKNTGGDVSDEATCQAKFGTDNAEWNTELSKCVAGKNNGEYQCDALDDTEYYACYEMQPDTCGGTDYDTTPSIARTLLNCRKTPNAECKTKEACESSGECYNGLRRRYWFDNEEHYMDNVCVAPAKDTHGHGWYDCQSYASEGNTNYWEEIEQLQDHTCVLLKKTENECATIEGGVWTSTFETQETCEDKKLCKVSDWRYNQFDQTECSKCNKNFEYVGQWHENTWQTGKMTDTFYWIDRKWDKKNKWVSEIDSWRLEHVMRELVERLEEETEAQFVQCMYTGLMESVKKIACVCGENRDQCDTNEIFNGLATIVNTTAYKNAKEIAGNEMTTRLELEKASVENVCNVTLEEQGAYVPNTNTTITKDGEGSRRLRRERIMRRLDDNSDTLNSAECMTVVKNSNNVLVGQLVGNCVKANFSESLATASTLCLDVKPVIEIADAFSVKGFADYDAAADKYTARPEVAVVQGEQYCITVSETSFLCPVNRIEDYAAATEDAGSDECNLIVHIAERVRKQQECNEGLCGFIGTPEFWAGLGESE
ncbi:hypothetical protein TL16_g05051 [Triparma laevis f. inornata]|uniref:Uncharacterized protein n=1 Tax=Triparma laevis f. inornata TaxID=1714386 RepID=A0A9W7AE80_9STRA|nr:hypothetical protein TL16_g05051 [Triparma laevis f. inornata]